MNLIVGGTHGLGSCIAQELQQAGEETFILGRSYDETEHGKGAALDLSDLASVKEFARNDAVIAQATAFYWIAGSGYMGDFAQQPEPEKMAAANFGNVLPLAQAVWKSLLQQKVGKFVVISSTSGQRARPTETVYAATKHAQVGFARSLGLESERLQSPVKVSLFMPGGMQTPFWDTNSTTARPENFSEYLDPKKVAKEIVRKTHAQQDYFYEQMVERGSL